MPACEIRRQALQSPPDRLAHLGRQLPGERDDCPHCSRADVAALAPYVPGDQPREAGWVKLNTNEHPDVLPGITDAVRAALDEQLRLYPDPTCSALRDRLAERYDVPPERIIVGNGSDELLALTLRACVDPGERVVTAVPNLQCVSHAGRDSRRPTPGDRLGRPVRPTGR